MARDAGAGMTREGTRGRREVGDHVGELPGEGGCRGMVA